MAAIWDTNQNHEEYHLPDMDLFTPAFVQGDIDSGKFERVYPLTKLEDNGPIEFLVENATEKSIHLANSYLKGKYKVVHKDKANWADDANTFIENYIIGSIFQQVDFILNNQIISISINTYS